MAALEVLRSHQRGFHAFKGTRPLRRKFRHLCKKDFYHLLWRLVRAELHIEMNLKRKSQLAVVPLPSSYRISSPFYEVRVYGSPMVSLELEQLSIYLVYLGRYQNNNLLPAHRESYNTKRFRNIQLFGKHLVLSTALGL